MEESHESWRTNYATRYCVFESYSKTQRKRIDLMQEIVAPTPQYYSNPSQKPGMTLELINLKLRFLEDMYRQFLKTHEEMVLFTPNPYEDCSENLVKAFQVYRKGKEKLIAKRYEVANPDEPTNSS